MNNTLRSYLAEFLGTFTLVFVGTAVVVLQQGGLLSTQGWGPVGLLGISFAFGGTLMVLVLVIGPVSGCHINPAVTIPMAVAGRMKWKDVPGYLIAQCVGALAASFVLHWLLNGIASYKLSEHGLGANGNPLEMTHASLFGWELVLTALFLYTIFSATRSDQPTGFAALAIGGYLFVAHLIGAQLGDSSLNPARSLGPAVLEGGNALSILWIFVVAPICGGLIGFGLFRLLHDEKAKTQ